MNGQKIMSNAAPSYWEMLEADLTTRSMDEMRTVKINLDRPLLVTVGTKEA